MGQHVAHEMDAAALPGGVQHLGDGRFQPFVGVRDHQLDAAQAPPRQLAQEVGPEGLGLTGADGHAQDFASPGGVGTDRDDHRHADDAAVLAHLDAGGVEPDIGPVALQRAVEEGGDLAVDFGAQAADLAFRDAGHAHGLDQIVDRPCRDALDIGFPDDGGQRLFRHPAGLREARQIAALAQAWDAQRHRPCPGLPVALAVAVAVDKALIGLALTMPGAGQRRHLQLHQPLGGKTDHLAQQIGISPLFQQATKAHHFIGHRLDPWFGWGSQPNPTEDRR